MQLLQLAITFLFAALIAVDGTSHDSRPSGHGKTTCGNDEDALYNTLINSAGSQRQHIAGHLNCPKYS